MMPPITAHATAKINIHLAVGALRNDGFHDLTTVYQAISLHDTVRITPAERMSVSGGGPTDNTNLAWRAASELASELGITDAALTIEITKTIPIAGGLAGGSADAAAVLRAAGKLWGATAAQLDTIAARLGSDVPFALHGGVALGTGHGEILTPVLTRGTYHWVVVAAKGQLSTPAVYRELDRIRAERQVPPSAQAGSTDAVIAALAGGDPYQLAPHLINDLQAAALSLMPALRKTLQVGQQAGALGSLVSGSGPTCLFLAEDGAHATGLAAEIAGRVTAASIRVASGPVHGARLEH